MVEAQTISATEVEAPCCHHWLIENPNGETSRGVCKYCSASREFRNYVPSGQNQYRTRKDAASPASPTNG